MISSKHPWFVSEVNGNVSGIPPWGVMSLLFWKRATFFKLRKYSISKGLNWKYVGFLSKYFLGIYWSYHFSYSSCWYTVLKDFLFPKGLTGLCLKY